MPKKILIIEDQAPMRRNVALMLELEGYATCTAENGRIGIEVARKERPDLILCDVMMPEMTGHDVIQELRDDDHFDNTPFIFLSAKSDRNDIRTGMNFGADDYLTKPVVREDLLGAIRTRLARAEALRQRLAESNGFNPDFARPDLLEHAHRLTPREAEVLCWVAQGKSNADVAIILGMSAKTVKHHLGIVFQKMGVESRNAASVVALETLRAR